MCVYERRSAYYYYRRRRCYNIIIIHARPPRVTHWRPSIIIICARPRCQNVVVVTAAAVIGRWRVVSSEPVRSVSQWPPLSFAHLNSPPPPPPDDPTSRSRFFDAAKAPIGDQSLRKSVGHRICGPRTPINDDH